MAEVQKLIAEAEADGDHVLATAIALGAVTGARRGELCALRWSDVDTVRGVLSVSRSLTVLATKATEGPTKTHQRRDIAIDAALASLLAARKGQQESYAGLAGVELVEDPYVLSRSFGRLGTLPYRTGSAWRMPAWPNGSVSSPISTSCATFRQPRQSPRASTCELSPAGWATPTRL